MKKSFRAMAFSVGVAIPIFLAPFTTYATSYKMIPMSITFNDKKVANDATEMGFQVTDPVTGKLTTFMPDWYINDLLQSTPIFTSWDGHNFRLTVPSEYFSYQPMTPVHATTSRSRENVYVNGVNVETPPVLTAVDPRSSKRTNYLPVWYFQQILDAVGITNVWHKPVWTMSWNNDGILGNDHGLKYTKFWGGSSKINLSNDPYNFDWIYFFDPIPIKDTFAFPFDASFENASVMRAVGEKISDDEYRNIDKAEYKLFNGLTFKHQGNYLIISTSTFSLPDQWYLRIDKADDWLNAAYPKQSSPFYSQGDNVPLSYRLDGGTTWVDAGRYSSVDADLGGSMNPPSRVMVRVGVGANVMIRFGTSYYPSGDAEALVAKYTGGKLILELGSDY